ncbi:hypothetical protein PENTCL1PPCAC_9098, partial [Pristionchus entomophagus]
MKRMANSDFINRDIDLNLHRHLSLESHYSFTNHQDRSRPPGFERDLFEGSLDLSDLPPPAKGVDTSIKIHRSRIRSRSRPPRFERHQIEGNLDIPDLPPPA